jgi:hypothetical protein
MSKIIKSGRPLVVTRTYETHRRCSCQPLHYINRDLGSALRGRLPQHTLDDLRPGTLGTEILHQLRDREITALHRTREQHPRSAIRIDHDPTASRFTAPVAPRAASPTRSPAHLGPVHHGHQDQHRPGQAQYLVHAPSAQPAAVHGLVNGVQDHPEAADADAGKSQRLRR